MAEQREAREIIAGALKTPYYSRKPHATPEEIAHERAEDVLAALAAEGWSVERLELVAHAGVHGDIGFADCNAPWPDSEPLYRVISPSTREAEKP